MEADQPGLARLDGWRAQVARWANGGLVEGLLIERVLLGLEGHDLLAFGDVDLRGVREQFVNVACAESCLASVNRLTDGGPGVLEERIGALAARSTLAVVVPVDLLCHDCRK